MITIVPQDNTIVILRISLYKKTNSFTESQRYNYQKKIPERENEENFRTFGFNDHVQSVGENVRLSR